MNAMAIFDLNVRSCNIEDLVFVHDLLKRNMEASMFRHWGEAWNSDLFWEKTKADSIIIIEHEGKKIAFFDAVIEGRVLHLININVEKEFQGQGIGGYMLSLAEKKALRLGAEKIALEVFPDNPSVALYEARGFVKVGEENSCFLMEKVLCNRQEEI